MEGITSYDALIAARCGSMTKEMNEMLITTWKSEAFAVVHDEQDVKLADLAQTGEGWRVARAWPAPGLMFETVLDALVFLEDNR